MEKIYTLHQYLNNLIHRLKSWYSLFPFSFKNPRSAKQLFSTCFFLNFLFWYRFHTDSSMFTNISLCFVLEYPNNISCDQADTFLGKERKKKNYILLITRNKEYKDSRKYSKVLWEPLQLFWPKWRWQWGNMKACTREKWVMQYVTSVEIYAVHIGYGQGFLVRKGPFQVFIISIRAEKDKLDALIIPNPGGGIELSFAFSRNSICLFKRL